MKEGFWYDRYSKIGRRYPMPVAHNAPWKGQKEFLEELGIVESRFAEVSRQKGSSKCRICGCRNGSTEFKFKSWIWPSGFKHYVEDHNVIPSREFRMFVRSNSGKGLRKRYN